MDIELNLGLAINPFSICALIKWLKVVGVEVDPKNFPRIVGTCRRQAHKTAWLKWIKIFFLIFFASVIWSVLHCINSIVKMVNINMWVAFYQSSQRFLEWTLINHKPCFLKKKSIKYMAACNNITAQWRGPRKEDGFRVVVRLFTKRTALEN